MNKRIEETKREYSLPAQKIRLKTHDSHVFIEVENLKLQILDQQEVQDVMTDQSIMLVKGAIRKNLPTKITMTAALKGMKFPK